jgi:16S rRNA C967 or C1407 C5-methylase (RsmB/RsmF family)
MSPSPPPLRKKSDYEDEDEANKRKRSGKRKPLPFSQVRTCRAQAAKVLSKLLRCAREKKNGASIKSLTLDAKRIDFPSATHAIVCETVKVLPLLRLLIKENEEMRKRVLFEDDDDDEKEEDEDEDDTPPAAKKQKKKTNEKILPESMAYVLLYELLLSPGKSITPPRQQQLVATGREGEGAKSSAISLTEAEKVVTSKTEELRNQLKERLRKANAASALEFVERRLPERVRKIVNDDPMSRFARVNAMKVRDAGVLVKELKERGFAFEEEDAHLGGGEGGGGCRYISFSKDCDRKKLSGMKMVKNGELILQGKSSCMPAHCLLVNEEERLSDDMSAIFERICQSDVIDACAAPGNKTTHLAALLNDKKNKNGRGGGGKVFAFEKDHRRAQRLRDTIDLYGCSKKVIVAKKNFLEVDENDDKYRNVRSILLDPSCSGSGTVQNRGDALMEYALKDGYDDEDEDEDDAERNKRREEEENEEEQTRKKRVMSLQKFQVEVLSHAMRFPGVLRISYSTCSIYREENEDVVQKVMPLAKELGFELAKCLPKWPRRGFSEVLGEAEASKVVRVNPFEGDDCEGFFVAVFQRKKELCEKIIAAFEKEREEKKSKQKNKNKRELESGDVVVVVPVLNATGNAKKKKKNGGSKMPLFR